MRYRRPIIQSNRIEWVQFLTLFITIVGLFFLAIQQSTNMIDAIRLEIKDFHGRLCTIEEKHRNRE